MRLVGRIKDEVQARIFSEFLRIKNVKNFYEPGEGEGFIIWVEDEDDLAQSLEWFNTFEQNPKDPLFIHIAPQKIISPEIATEAPPLITAKARIKPAKSSPLTNFIIVICSLLFLWNGGQEIEIVKTEGTLALQVGLTPIQRTLIFDFPKAYEELLVLIKENSVQNPAELENLPPEIEKKIEEVEKIPSWKGIYERLVNKKNQPPLKDVPLFEKIRKGEIWRFVTPIFLHRDFLHILFNMVWVWLLCKQIEARLEKKKLILLIFLTAIVSNTAQYLMGGPYFLGFSGVACGMAGFIWMRQRIAPWEGYPLQKEAVYFLGFFVLAMFGLELISFFMEIFSSKGLSLGIANTAHIFGFISGGILARFPFFSVR